MYPNSPAHGAAAHTRGGSQVYIDSDATIVHSRALQKNNADVSPAVAKIIKIDGEKHRSSTRGAPES